MTWALLVPFAAYFLANLAIGLYGRRILAGRGGRNFVEEYYVGSRSLGPVVLAFTLTTSLASAGTFLGTPALSYREGFVWLVIGIGQMTSGYLMLGVLGKKFAIIGRKVGAFTVPRVLAARFPHPMVGGGTAFLMVFFLLFYMAAQFIGGARIFESLSGVPYVVGLTVMALTTVVYTTVGGFRAVVLTDTLQGAIMLVGVVALFGAIVHHAGGLEPLTAAMIAVRPSLVTPDAGGEYSIPRIVSMTWILLGVATVGLPHAAVRSLSYKDSRALHRGILLSGVMMFVFSFLTWFSGVAANVVLGPDLEVPDQVIPLSIIALFSISSRRRHSCRTLRSDHVDGVLHAARVRERAGGGHLRRWHEAVADARVTSARQPARHLGTRTRCLLRGVDPTAFPSAARVLCHRRTGLGFRGAARLWSCIGRAPTP